MSERQPRPAPPFRRQRVELDARAIAKGWAVTVALWLAVLFFYFWMSNTLYAPEPGSAPSDGLGYWTIIFALVSVAVALVAGLPLGLVLSWVLSPIRQQWIHVSAFFAVPTLVLAIPFLAEPGNGLAPLGLGAVLGLCCAAGRAAIIRNATIREAPAKAVGP